MVTPCFSRNVLVYSSTRDQLDSMSGLPPLKAATTFAPATWSFAAGLLRISVNAVTCEVSSPMMPRRISAAVAADTTRSEATRTEHREVMPPLRADRPGE